MTRAPDPTRGRTLLGAAGQGAIAGLVGVAVMTVAEKAEQRVTHRPNSYVPARTLLTLLGRHAGQHERPALWNHAMHWGTGALMGALRGVWAVVGLRGPQAHVAHTVVRLATDQTLENATGSARRRPHGPDKSGSSTTSTRRSTRSRPVSSRSA
jgi:hypothetical protein